MVSSNSVGGRREARAGHHDRAGSFQDDARGDRVPGLRFSVRSAARSDHEHRRRPSPSRRSRVIRSRRSPGSPRWDGSTAPRRLVDSLTATSPRAGSISQDARDASLVFRRRDVVGLRGAIRARTPVGLVRRPASGEVRQDALPKAGEIEWRAARPILDFTGPRQRTRLVRRSITAIDLVLQYRYPDR